ncbi:MAG: hypothetical protein ACTS1Z_05520 [Parasphingopyxis sp.]|uniref:hypothetical protein n=1 Tax=Parasphingopyxis sp. TaxID=1920299 RepID=UPI003F9F7617
MPIPITFHIGMPKTGTSALQNCISDAERDDALSALFYPKTGRRIGDPPTSLKIAHHDIATALRDGPDAAGLQAELLAEIGRAPVSGNGSQALISSEGFTNMVGAEAVATLLEFFAPFRRDHPFKAIMVVREFASFFESMYLQSARFGNRRSDFEGDLETRSRWLEKFATGLHILQDELGDELVIIWRRPGFDIIEFFERELGLGQGALSSRRDRLPKTATPPLKLQTALTFVEQLNDRHGLNLTRNELVQLSQQSPLFLDDTPRYTLYSEGAFDRYRVLFHDIFSGHGFDEYADVSQSQSPDDLPSVTLDIDLLGPSDIEILRAVDARSSGQ